VSAAKTAANSALNNAQEEILMAGTGIRKTALSLAVAGAFAGGVSQAHASAFALIEQNASGMGNAYAGAAAAAEDASTIYYNPAGMSLLPGGMQISIGLALINLSAKFSDSGSTQSGTPAAPSSQAPLGGTGGNAGGLSAVPNFYFATDLAKDLKIGVGISVPFGLKTEYDADWMGRFQAIKSDIATFNVNPSVAYKVSEDVSLGFGLSYQQINAELSNAVNFAAATYGATGGNVAATNAVAAAGREGTASVKGSDSAWGYNLGAMFKVAPDTRMGLSYRSSIKYNVTGTVVFSGVPVATLTAINPALAAAFSDGNVSLDVELPASASLAVQHKLDPKWTLLGDVTWTGWSKIKQLVVTRDNGATLSTTPENFKDTWRVGIGATYRKDDAWSIKMGVAYDETPVNDTDRTARLPDNNRIWLSVGGQYRLSKDGTLDFGYSHLFIKDAPINQPAPGSGSPLLTGQLVGNYKGSVDIFGAQFAYRF
jgi:long-chain fatty acid transport protein